MKVFLDTKTNLVPICMPHPGIDPPPPTLAFLTKDDGEVSCLVRPPRGQVNHAGFDLTRLNLSSFTWRKLSLRTLLYKPVSHSAREAEEFIRSEKTTYSFFKISPSD